jgi:hypothetical protein
MPAKDNDPKVPKSPAKKIAKTTGKKPAAKAVIEAKPSDETSPAAEPIVAPKAARARRAAVAKPDAAVPAVASATEAPKRRASVRRPKAVAAATEAATETVEAPAPATTSSAKRDDTRVSFEEEVRLRAYLLYAERGHRGGSAESDWYRAEREVAHGRQA